MESVKKATEYKAKRDTKEILEAKHHEEIQKLMDATEEEKDMLLAVKKIKVRIIPLQCPK